jgi:hypothetical protein
VNVAGCLELLGGADGIACANAMEESIACESVACGDTAPGVHSQFGSSFGGQYIGIGAVVSVSTMWSSMFSGSSSR